MREFPSPLANIVNCWIISSFTTLSRPSRLPDAAIKLWKATFSWFTSEIVSEWGNQGELLRMFTEWLCRCIDQEPLDNKVKKKLNLNLMPCLTNCSWATENLPTTLPSWPRKTVSVKKTSKVCPLTWLSCRLRSFCLLRPNDAINFDEDLPSALTNENHHRSDARKNSLKGRGVKKKRRNQQTI